MRDSKFRGKRLDNGSWTQGDLIQLLGEQGQGRKFIVDNRFGACIDSEGNFVNTEAPFVNEVDPETVGQYVNYYGIEFYNGDIMLIACDCDSEYGCTHNDGIYTVVWNKETAGYALKSQSNGRLYPLDEYGEENMHVAGNIYDNPELLQPQGGGKGE
ncbi:YopX family protein [Paenibacillus sp. S25]|uniref:YopX family protein n=1 Tax=Paenibacillus sp. S25 TaxID=2823905 RepID=UPI001C64FD0D|nr:YopX family protein [Paenibacillus sp. S25]QYK61811.1 hypothetical protein KAI37_02135 [Paenibacillus sp. S25]